MSTGAMTGAGAAGGVAAGAAGAASGVTPSAGASGTSPAQTGSQDGATQSNNSVDKDQTSNEKTGIHVHNNMHQHNNMSCQSFIELHNSTTQPVGKAEESSELDMKKLIEMMMAIKLLEAINKTTSDGGNDTGFSTIA